MTETHVGDLEGLGFDEVVSRLRSVVARLEQGNLTLEESLRAYEEGVGLARRGHTLLDSAEQRVELLVRKRGDGIDTAPFDESDRERDDAD